MSVNFKVEEEIKSFLHSTVLFKGPDPEIMKNHALAPLSELEKEAMAVDIDRTTKTIIRNRLQMVSNEATEMLSHIASAPSAKWGDLICGIFTGSGDLSLASSNGVLLFSVLAHHPIKYIIKNWKNSSTVGIKDGDIFMHNDARYGNVHNTDQSCLLPIFYDGKLVAWAGSIIHEGENGACEPGGMPSSALSPYDEGLKISPMKIGENFQLRDDIVTYFQNSVRDPKMQLEDMRAKLAATMRVRDRVLDVIKEYGIDTFIAILRETLEDTATEVRRRIAALPDGKASVVQFVDGTLRENIIVKINCTVEVKGEEVLIDFRGSSPEFLNRANNTVLCSLKGMLAQVFLNYVWPDLPRNQAVLVPFRFLTDEHSVLNCSQEAPNSVSMMTFFPSFTAVEHCMMKFLFNNLQNGNPAKATDVHADWWNSVSGFLYGGYSQHGYFVGNVTTDINGMGGGARWNRDGEHSLAPIFCAMGDLGETEALENEIPMLGLSYRQLMQDNQGFGKFRGGHGHTQIVTFKESPLWGWMTITTGSKFPNINGLFGGYASHCYPLCKVKETNVLEEIQQDLQKATYNIVDIMNEKPFKGKYLTQHKGLQFEVAQPGELYMQAQGAGGGYGDVLERDPENVMRDVRQGLVSDWVVTNIYKVAYDKDTLLVKEKETKGLRDKELQDRLKRGKPYAEFIKDWVKQTPPENVPFYGCWDNIEEIYAGNPGTKMKASQLQGVYL